MDGICELLDHGDATRPYRASLRHQAEKLDDPARTPSARVLTELRSTGESFFDLALRMSGLHRRYCLDLQTPDESRQAVFAQEAAESLEKQRAIEAADREPFEVYLEKYFRGATG